jgi:spore coat protein A
MRNSSSHKLVKMDAYESFLNVFKFRKVLYNTKTHNNPAAFLEETNVKKQNSLFLLIVFCLTIISSLLIQIGFSQQLQLLDPLIIPKFVNQLDQPPAVYVPDNVTDSGGNLIRQEYTVKISEFSQQILPFFDANGNPTGFGPTKVWGYGGNADDAVTGAYLGYIQSTPGPTFEAIRDVPTKVTWVNNLVDASGNPLPNLLAVDPSIHWANPNGITMPTEPITAPAYPPGYPDAQSPVPIVTHLHGGEDPSAYDGGPEQWFTPNGIHGPSYNTSEPTDSNAAVYEYPNGQEPAMLWYHDHALGITRLNVMSGLAGFYLLRDPADSNAAMLPSGQYEMPLVIQDRDFLADGSLYYPTNSACPNIHPYWTSSFLGNIIMVNGKVWPNMDVQQAQYRFRILDGSNSRSYLLTFSNGMNFTQIATDGGYLKAPATLTSVLISPAERIDIVVDFSNLEPGTKVILRNTALTNQLIEDQTVGQILQFTVTNQKGPKPFSVAAAPEPFNPTLTGTAFPTLPNATKTRLLTLVQVNGTGDNTLEMLLDGQIWDAPVTEMPVLGSTEDWVIINPSSSEHPIHLHLVQFQVLQRQSLDSDAYMKAWKDLNGPAPLNHTTVNVQSLSTYLTGQPRIPEANEQGWKDTTLVYAGEVSTIRVRFTKQDGSPFPFDATTGPGYVWHCHLLEHEDNEMMRPYIVISSPQQLNLEVITIVATALVVIVVSAGLIVYRHLHNHPKKRT